MKGKGRPDLVGAAPIWPHLPVLVPSPRPRLPRHLPSEQSVPAVRPVLSGIGAILPSERRNTMRKLLVALTLLSASLSTAAFAQAGRGTDAEQKACTRDVQKFKEMPTAG